MKKKKQKKWEKDRVDFKKDLYFPISACSTVAQMVIGSHAIKSFISKVRRAAYSQIFSIITSGSVQKIFDKFKR